MVRLHDAARVGFAGTAFEGRRVDDVTTLVILDEDVRGGASAFLLQHILEDQKGYQYLDGAPVTITSKDHRPAFASDGDYFSKPSHDDIVEQLYAVMHEKNPELYPSI